MVTQARVQVGIVGKPNAGKSTFFAAATMKEVKISPVPFTTIDPNVGIGYARLDSCPCSEVQCNPRSYAVIEGACFAPVELVDVAGLVPGAWQGRGLGNQFLDHLRRAPALIHVVDASGSTDEEGRIVKPGSRDPVLDVEFLDRELDLWLASILRKDWDRISRSVEYAKKELAEVLYERLAGLGVARAHVEAALEDSGLSRKAPSSWSHEELAALAKSVRLRSKPMVIAANKVDLPEGEEGYRRLREAYPDRLVVPVSAEAELALRRAAARGLVRYRPGDGEFQVVGNLTQQQRAVLDRVAELLRKFGGTGVVQAISTAVFKALGYVAVFPVEDERRLTDREGRVLPDLLLVPGRSTAKDVAYAIHTELGERFVAAVDVKSGRRIPADGQIRHGMIIKVLAR